MVEVGPEIQQFILDLRSSRTTCDPYDPSTVPATIPQPRGGEDRWPGRFAGRFEGPDLARRHAAARLKEEEGQAEARSRGPTQDGKDGEGERLMETISCSHSAVIKRAPKTWLLSLRAATFRFSAKKAWNEVAGQEG
jgi:hypothetical protein